MSHCDGAQDPIEADSSSPATDIRGRGRTRVFKSIHATGVQHDLIFGSGKTEGGCEGRWTSRYTVEDMGIGAWRRRGELDRTLGVVICNLKSLYTSVARLTHGSIGKDVRARATRLTFQIL